MPPRTPSKSPSKSPAKTRPASPAMRRTPRHAKPPSRLGQNDDWGVSSPAKWVSETVTTRKAREEELYKERLAFVEHLNEEVDAKGKPGLLARYETLMSEYMWLATIVQSVVLTVVGFAVGQLIKGEAITGALAGQWAGWGVISSITSLPYFLWLNRQKFGASSETNALLKALFNQAGFSQLQNVLFLSYWALLTGKDPVIAITTGMLSQAKLSVSFWLPSDLINLYLVPLHAQMLWNAVLGIMWSALLAYFY
ncbi:hypothetical protein AB1Y20_001553 [Prymnesium parvum]|uniref:Uncharacterized protein n=1 Tax=Prymnesium parvum TaxID=97485 RepID=A0AB34KC04_PRYPA